LVSLCPECLILGRLLARYSPKLLEDLHAGQLALVQITAALGDAAPDIAASQGLGPAANSSGAVFGVLARGPGGKPFYAFAFKDPKDPTVAIVGKQQDRILLTDCISVHSTVEAARRAYYRYRRLGSKPPGPKPGR